MSEETNTNKGAACWRLLTHGAADAATNMAIDEAMILSLAAEETLPTLRFYAWNPAAVSIGYFQKADAELDLRSCEEQGIDVVRRLTGGRAVLHDKELTYSLVVPEAIAYVPSTITASYLFFSRGIVAGLASLGIEAHMHIPRSAYGQGTRSPHSAVCFDSPSDYEITVDGRKLVGSAQVRRDGVILQHGSILLRFDAEKWASVFRWPDAETGRKMVATLQRRAVGLNEVCARNVGGAEVAAAIAAGMATECALHFSPGALTPREIADTEKLRHNYAGAEWNFRR